jgi:sulfate adenylyltransferase
VRQEGVDNALSPHGGRLVERILPPGEAARAVEGLEPLPVRGEVARECISIAYGFFSPLEGFMGRADVEAVLGRMRLASGYVWSIPIVFDLPAAEVEARRLREGDRLLLTFQGQPLAVMDVQEVFGYDRVEMARLVYGTTDERHPGVRRTYGYADRFVAGPVTLVNAPVFNPPFDRFWLPPRELRRRFAERGWSRVVAHQTRNVPHTGHEWLMKSAWFSAGADAVLVNAVVGEKRPGDYIDEAIVLGHDALREAGYFRQDVHAVSMLLWDMRYAGPREAVFHAVVRKNLGCTHHMFGRDHAGVGRYYDTFAAHRIFAELPDLGIAPVLTLEWSYCPECAGVAYEGLCGHADKRQPFSGSVIRSILMDGVKPPRMIMRPEVFDVVMQAAEAYGSGSPFVDDRYLKEGRPAMTIPPLAPGGRG